MLSNENEAALFIVLIQIMLTAALLICIVFEIRSSYVLVIILIPLDFSNLLITKTRLKNEPGKLKQSSFARFEETRKRR